MYKAWKWVGSTIQVLTHEDKWILFSFGPLTTEDSLQLRLLGIPMLPKGV